MPSIEPSLWPLKATNLFVMRVFIITHVKLINPMARKNGTVAEHVLVTKLFLR